MSYKEFLRPLRVNAWRENVGTDQSNQIFFMENDRIKNFQ